MDTLSLNVGAKQSLAHHPEMKAALGMQPRALRVLWPALALPIFSHPPSPVFNINLEKQREGEIYEDRHLSYFCYFIAFNFYIVIVFPEWEGHNWL